jgi:uncharacterized damage-inducible protein DinB
MLLIAIALALCTAGAWAQSTPAQTPAPKPTISSVLDRQLSGVEHEFVDLADAMPENKYNFAPTNGEFKGVRNFGEQVKHVAATNYLIFSAMLGEKPPAGSDGENGPAALKTKAEIMKYLRDSFALGHRAVQSITEQNAVEPNVPNPFGGKNPANRLGLTTLIVGHTFDHYGQLVEYARMNGIIPPASRPRK